MLMVGLQLCAEVSRCGTAFVAEMEKKNCCSADGPAQLQGSRALAESLRPSSPPLPTLLLQQPVLGDPAAGAACWALYPRLLLAGCSLLPPCCCWSRDRALPARGRFWEEASPLVVLLAGKQLVTGWGCARWQGSQGWLRGAGAAGAAAGRDGDGEAETESCVALSVADVYCTGWAGGEGGRSERGRGGGQPLAPGRCVHSLWKAPERQAEASVHGPCTHVSAGAHTHTHTHTCTRMHTPEHALPACGAWQRGLPVGHPRPGLQLCLCPSTGYGGGGRAAFASPSPGLWQGTGCAWGAHEPQGHHPADPCPNLPPVLGRHPSPGVCGGEAGTRAGAGVGQRARTPGRGPADAHTGTRSVIQIIHRAGHGDDAAVASVGQPGRLGAAGLHRGERAMGTDFGRR